MRVLLAICDFTTKYWISVQSSKECHKYTWENNVFSNLCYRSFFKVGLDLQNFKNWQRWIYWLYSKSIFHYSTTRGEKQSMTSPVSFALVDSNFWPATISWTSAATKNKIWRRRMFLSESFSTSKKSLTPKKKTFSSGHFNLNVSVSNII